MPAARNALHASPRGRRALQVVARAFHRQQIRARRESAHRRRATLPACRRGRAVPWTNSAGVRQSGKKRGARLLRLPRRMQRIGEQQQPVGQIRTFRRGHRGLPCRRRNGRRRTRAPSPRCRSACTARATPSRSRAAAAGNGGPLARSPAKRQIVAQHQIGRLRRMPAPDSPAAARWHSSPLRASAPAHRRCGVLRAVCSTPRSNVHVRLLRKSCSIAGPAQRLNDLPTHCLCSNSSRRVIPRQHGARSQAGARIIQRLRAPAITSALPAIMAAYPSRATSAAVIVGPSNSLLSSIPAASKSPCAWGRDTVPLRSPRCPATRWRSPRRTRARKPCWRSTSP